MSMEWSGPGQDMHRQSTDSQPFTWASVDWRLVGWWALAAVTSAAVWVLLVTVLKFHAWGLMPWQN